ncbi:transposase, partial [Escherichia coli]|nr:transposase [Escherichia coli]
MKTITYLSDTGCLEIQGASLQTYTVADAAKAMDVGLSTMTRWVKQLRDERQGKTPKASPITPEQIEIR